MPNLRVPKTQHNEIFSEGYKHLQGLEEAILRNISAASELASVVRTSLGPLGRNKLIVNHLEKLFVTSDAATITREMEVVHPAAKLVCLGSQAQDTEVGDGTNLAIILAGELLSRAEPLLKMGIHPSEIVAGYEVAHKEAIKYLEDMSVKTVTGFDDPNMEIALRSVIGSKQYGLERQLAKLVIDAARIVVEREEDKSKPFNVDSVRVVKILGGSLSDSRVIRGMVFSREPEGALKQARDTKVAIFTCPLDVSSTETKGTVLLKTASQLSTYSQDEEKFVESVLGGLKDAGVGVVVTGSTVNDMALHFLNRMGILVVKILSKFELRRLCRVTGASAMTRLGKPTPEEIGHCDYVETIEIGSDRCTVFRQEGDKTRTATIVVRGGTQNFCDDVERAIDDGVNSVKAFTRDGRLVPGGGATEMAISSKLQQKAEKTPGLSQYAIKAYAEALEVVPRTLSESAGQQTIEVMSNLIASHAKPGNSGIGIQVDESETDHALRDMVEASILDSLVVKLWAMKHASDAAFTILRVDEIIMAKPAGGPKPRGPNKNWDEE